MFIVINDEGNSWDGLAWSWKATRGFLSTSAAIRSLQEAGEDIDNCHIVEDVFSKDDHCIPA
jgi:hypothetical protein